MLNSVGHVKIRREILRSSVYIVLGLQGGRGRGRGRGGSTKIDLDSLPEHEREKPYACDSKLSF